MKSLNLTDRSNSPAYVRSRCPRIQWMLCAIFAWTCLTSSASAIDIVADYKWGFNGKVAPHRFNVLSVLLNNPTPKPFEGDIRLQKSLGGAGTVDAAIVEHVVLGPYSQKWVQFFPYVTSEAGYSGENWRMTWPGSSYDLQVPRLAKYQRIILDDPNSVSAKGGSIKFHLADNLFPPFVTATDALQLVALDHVPRWEEARRQSFLDWIYLGGTVVILHEPSGKFPDFTGPLSILKTPLEDQMYGSGRILRVPLNRSLFTDDELRQVCMGLPKNYPKSPTTSSIVSTKPNRFSRIRILGTAREPTPSNPIRFSAN